MVVDVRSTGKIDPNATVTVTGYSLGGHLATAFTQLHNAEVSAAYTFNGAGIGLIKPGNTLSSVIEEFNLRRAGGSEDLFSDESTRSLY